MCAFDGRGETMSEYIPVIGLEVHAELSTGSKVFCSCSAEFGGGKNLRCCPVCSGMPGTLPVVNRTAVEYAIKAGFAMGCEINKFTYFDRKNYFYPDLPKAYQISQLGAPLCINGLVPIEYEENGIRKTKNIRINRIHLEEDAGKLIHDDHDDVSLADYNRCGVPLIEIVTEPDMSSAAEAKAFVEKVMLLLKYVGVSDCRMEQGSVRADVNVSLMRSDDTELGTRAEMKNINSVKFIGKAIDFEITRQSRLLDMGQRIVQETRRFDVESGETKTMRSKENAHDYRYFPEPDIPPIEFTDEQLNAVRNSLPELPEQRMERYQNEFGLNEIDAKILVSDKLISDLFDSAIGFYNAPISICKFINGEFMRRLKLGEITPDALPFTAEQLAKLVEMSDAERITKDSAKEIFKEMSEACSDPETIAEKRGLLISNDIGKAVGIIEKVISENERAVAQYRSGDKKVFGFIMGQCTKALKGVCTPKVIKEELEKRLIQNSI